MAYKPSDDKTLGIDIDGDRLYIAYLAAERGEIKLKNLFKGKISENPADVNPLYIENDEELLRMLLKNCLSISALNTNDLLVRRLRLKLTREKDIEEAFAFQAEPLLPFPMENGIVDKMIIEKQEGATLLALIAARKDYIKRHFELLDKLELNPEVVSTAPSALATFSNFFVQTEDPVFAIHIGNASSSCILVRQGKPLASHGTSLGVKSLEEAYQLDFPNGKDFANLDLAQLSKEKHPHLAKAIEKITQEISWKVIAEAKETKLKEQHHLLITGEGSVLNGLVEKLKEKLPYSLIEIAQKPSFDIDPKSLKIYALAIGLALSGQTKIHQIVDFRQQEFAYLTPWKRFQKPLLTYAGLAFFLALSLYLFGHAYIAYSTDQLKERYLSMLAMIQKPYDEFERNYELKHPLERSGLDDSILSIQELTREDLEHRLDFLEREIRAMPDTFPLYPNVPRVSDVLAWLSTHPKVVCKDAEKDEENCSPLKIESFDYVLVKRPEQNKKNEKYQARVDLEFSTASPRIAREFHDALIAPNELIDPKGEVKWSSNRGKYRTTFYLKDKTQYPSPLKE